VETALSPEIKRPLPRDSQDLERKLNHASHFSVTSGATGDKLWTRFRPLLWAWGICPSSLWGVAHGSLATQTSTDLFRCRGVRGGDGIRHHVRSGREIRPLTQVGVARWLLGFAARPVAAHLDSVAATDSGATGR